MLNNPLDVFRKQNEINLLYVHKVIIFLESRSLCKSIAAAILSVFVQVLLVAVYL